MSSNSNKIYDKALEALRNKEYAPASEIFKTAENQFADNIDFRILKEVTALLLAVKDEIYEIEKDSFIVEEIYTHG
jgi:outer membrane protein assembly factor BamD (BamD/ComL family)